MAVNNTLNRKQYAGDGATVAFPTTFQFLDAEDLVVLETVDATGVETTKTLTTHYTVSGGNGSTGTITFLTAPAAGVTVTIYNDPECTQEVDLEEGGVSPAETKERAWDRLTFIAQRLKDRLSRTLRLPESENNSVVIPSVVERASKYMAFDADGDMIAADAPVDGYPVSAFMGTVLDDVDADAAFTTLGLSTYFKTLLAAANAAALRTLLGFTGTGSTVQTSLLDDGAVTPIKLASIAREGFLTNYSVLASVAANALTVAMKTTAGADPSAADPVYIPFRSSSATVGTKVVRTSNAAFTLTVPNTATLGQTNGLKRHLYFYAIDNAGTVEPAISAALYDEGSLVSTTLLDTGADSDTAIYSAAARANVPIRLLARIEQSQASIGVWDAAPTEVALPPFRLEKQIAVGTPVATNSGALTSTTFAAFPTNNPTLTFTPRRTGLYKVYANAQVEGSNLASLISNRIFATAGSPTVVFQGETNFESPVANYNVAVHPFTIVRLVAGTQYTFELQGAASSGTTTFKGTDMFTGCALVAEEL